MGERSEPIPSVYMEALVRKEPLHPKKKNYEQKRKDGDDSLILIGSLLPPYTPFPSGCASPYTVWFLFLPYPHPESLNSHGLITRPVSFCGFSFMSDIPTPPATPAAANSPERRIAHDAAAAQPVVPDNDTAALINALTGLLQRVNGASTNASSARPFGGPAETAMT